MFCFSATLPYCWSFMAPRNNALCWDKLWQENLTTVNICGQSFRQRLIASEPVVSLETYTLHAMNGISEFLVSTCILLKFEGYLWFEKHKLACQVVLKSSVCINIYDIFRSVGNVHWLTLNHITSRFRQEIVFAC